MRGFFLRIGDQQLSYYCVSSWLWARAVVDHIQSPAVVRRDAGFFSGSPALIPAQLDFAL